MHTGGFTLVELMISMVVAAGLLTTIAMAVASLAETYGASYAERQMKDSVETALRLLEGDIRRVGRALPADVLGAGPLDMLPHQALVQFLYQNLVRDINSNNQPDQLWLSGAGMDGSPTAERSSYVADYDPATGVLRVIRMDGDGVPDQYVPPSTAPSDPEDPALFAGHNFGGLAPLYVTISHPMAAFRSPAPLPIQTLTPVANLFGEHSHFDLQLLNIATLAAPPQAGDMVWYQRVVRNLDGTFSAPQHMQQARWYWVPDPADPNVGSLYRQLVADPADPISPTPELDGVPILDNVVDFQVAFLIWPCGGAAPIWVDHLLDGQSNTGAFSGAPFLTGVIYSAQADRLMALRERLMAVRVSILLREANPRPNTITDLFGAAGPSSFQVEDRTLNPGAPIDGRYRHFLIQQVYDPVLLRLSTDPDDPLQTFPRVRSAAVDAATFDGNTGACRGRRVM